MSEWAVRFTSGAWEAAQRLGSWERQNILHDVKPHVGQRSVYPELLTLSILDIQGKTVLLGLPDEE